MRAWKPCTSLLRGRPRRQQQPPAVPYLPQPEQTAASSSEQRLHRHLLFTAAYRCFTEGRWNHVSETQGKKKKTVEVLLRRGGGEKGWEKGVKCKWSWKISWFDSSSCFLSGTPSSLNICHVRLAKRREANRRRKKTDRSSRLLKIWVPEFLL